MNISGIAKRNTVAVDTQGGRNMSRRKMLQEQIEFLEEHDPNNEKIRELKEALKKSKKGRRSRRKGSNYERKVKALLKEWIDIDLERTPLSGGFAKGKNLKSVKGDLNTLDEDINFLLHIECKDQLKWAIKSWWKQAVDDCPKEKIPLIFLHQNQENKDGKRVQEAEDFVFIRAEDFFRLVDRNKIIKYKGEKKNE